MTTMVESVQSRFFFTTQVRSVYVTEKNRGGAEPDVMVWSAAGGFTHRTRALSPPQWLHFDSKQHISLGERPIPSHLLKRCVHFTAERWIGFVGDRLTHTEPFGERTFWANLCNDSVHLKELLFHCETSFQTYIPALLPRSQRGIQHTNTGELSWFKASMQY